MLHDLIKAEINYSLLVNNFFLIIYNIIEDTCALVSVQIVTNDFYHLDFLSISCAKIL